MSEQLLLDPAYTGDAPIAPSSKERSASADADVEGSWPRMLKLTEETETRLSRWIDNEIDGFNLERASLLEDWKAWQTLYWAAPAKKEKNFPFRKAANVVIPLAAIAVEALHARMMNTLFSVEPFWSIRPRSKEWIKAAKPFEKYLQSEVENADTLDMHGFCNETLMELGKLGTCVGKSGYEKDVRKSYKQVGETEEPVYYTVKNGAILERVPLANFILRFSEINPQTAPLVGEKHEVSWGQLKKYAEAKRISKDALEKIKTYWIRPKTSNESNDGSQLAERVDELAKTEPEWTQKFEFNELYLSFDVNKDGEDEEIVVDYHKESKTFLSIRYNWYDDLHRPYRICNFLNVEGIWPGIGICKMVEQQQEEVTTIHRQRLDNATLANMGQIVLKKNSGYGSKEPIFPGKIWFLDDPQKDIKEFHLSEMYVSSSVNEESAIRYFEKRSGANEAILGIPQEGTPGTATSDLTRLAEGNKRFDLVLKNIRRWMSTLGIDVITNYQLFGNQQVHWLVLGEDGAYVDAVLNMPSVLVRRGAIVDLTVTDSITNRETEKNQWLQLFQVITGYYDRVLAISQILAGALGPQGIMMFAQMAQRALMASDEAMRRLLETFTITDSDRFSLVEETPENTNGTGQPQPAVQPAGSSGLALPGGPASPNGSSQ